MNKTFSKQCLLVIKVMKDVFLIIIQRNLQEVVVFPSIVIEGLVRPISIFFRFPRKIAN